MEHTIPQFVRPFLWSYDVAKMDLQTDRQRIITNVLNFGDDQSVRWLWQIYSREEIKAVINQPRPGEWNDKSLNFWSLIFDLPKPRPPQRILA